jgi:hypothetical protein
MTQEQDDKADQCWKDNLCSECLTDPQYSNDQCSCICHDKDWYVENTNDE